MKNSETLPSRFFIPTERVDEIRKTLVAGAIALLGAVASFVRE